MATSLPDDQEIPFVLPTSGTDAKGNSVPLKGNLVVTVSDPTILAIVQPDPLTPTIPGSGVIRPVGPLGSAQVVITDTGDAISPLTLIIEVAVVGGTVTTLNPPVLGSLRSLGTQPATPPPA